MTKRSSEGDFGAALRDVDLQSVVYKPPDDARNRKPCDFMVWHREFNPACSMTPREEVVATWFEVKDVDAVDAFPFAELRPSQLAGIHDAQQIGIPYWLAVYWRRHKAWTISKAVDVVRWREIDATASRLPRDVPLKSVERELLMSRFGVDSSPANLVSTLKSVLLGDV